MTRFAAGIAWTFALTWAGNYVTLLTGLPAIVPAVVAVVMGAFVAADPLGRIWVHRSTRQALATMPSNPTVERIPEA